MQIVQAISAAYDFDLTAGDYTLADGAIEAVIERAPWSAFINPSQSRELIFYGQSDRLRRRRHTFNAGKFRPDLQEHSKRTMSAKAPDAFITRMVRSCGRSEERRVGEEGR